jgi:hypothetical protein
MHRAQNRGPTLPLSDTCGAAVVTRNIPFHVVSARWSVHSCTHLLNGTLTRIPSAPFFDAVFSRHTLCVSLVYLYAMLFDALSSRHSVFHCLCTPRYLCDCVWWDWCSVLKKLLLTTRSACGRCRRCQGIPTDVGSCGKTELRIGIFSRTCLVTRNLQLLIMLQLLPPINTHHPYVWVVIYFFIDLQLLIMLQLLPPINTNHP